MNVWVLRRQDGAYYIYGSDQPNWVAQPIVVYRSDFQWMKGFFGLRYQMRKGSKKLMRWRIPLQELR